MVPDRVQFIAAWCGLARLGAVQVPVDTRLRGNVPARPFSAGACRGGGGGRNPR